MRSRNRFGEKGSSDYISRLWTSCALVRASGRAAAAWSEGAQETIPRGGGEHERGPGGVLGVAHPDAIGAYARDASVDSVNRT